MTVRPTRCARSCRRAAAQELFNVLDLVAAAKAAAAAPAADPVPKDGVTGHDGGLDEEDASNDEGDDDEEAQQPTAADSAEAASAAAGGLQTFVFSATLTLPLALRRRLQKRALCA
jgi:hypothetical protein